MDAAPSLLLSLFLPAASADQDAALRLRLQPLLDGMRGEVGDLASLPNTTIGKEAAKVGLDLTKPANPVVALQFRDGRLFYVFYKVTEEAFGDRPWMIQRIKKTERTWSTAGGRPEEKVTWQVEAFKTIGGALKSADQHFGGFGLGGAHRREIVKEYEIGFGEIAGRAEGVAWPFEMDRLYQMLQEYDEAPGVHDLVRFQSSRRWTLTVQLAADGEYRLVAPELGIDMPKKVPGIELAKSRPDEASKSIVLVAGAGPSGLTVGVSRRQEVDGLLGEPLEDVPAGPNGRNCSYRGALVCNFDKSGVLNTVFTRSTFAGKTKEGIALGMPRHAVKQKLGIAAKDLEPEGAQWATPGLLVAFDASGAVQRLVVTKK
jgi:hypothetical protein